MSSNTTQVKDIIKKWVEEKAKGGEIEFDETFSTNDTIRYRTKEMTKRFPDNPKGKKEGWSLGRFLEPYPHYFYEIECKPTIKLKLAFSCNTMSKSTQHKCDEIMEKYTNRSIEPEENKGHLYRIPCIFHFKIDKNMNESDIRNEMNKLYYQMMGYESCIINNISEE